MIHGITSIDTVGTQNNPNPKRQRGVLWPVACAPGSDPRGVARRRVIVVVAMLVWIAPAAAETVILKNGAFVEGEVTVQTSTTVRVKTRFGERSFSRKEIEQIIESVDHADPEAVNKFAELPPAHKAVLNAQADYDLGRYERALSRLEPLRDYQENKAIRMKVDWLIIEINERLARWDVVKKMLEDKKEHGAPPEKIRAKAHLDIFEVNPEYDLRFVGKKNAKNFIRDEETHNRAKEPQSLKDATIMRLALEEYCEQLLVEDKQSVKAFGAKLKLDATYEAIKKASGSGDFSSILPYFKDLKVAEETLFKAQAVLGDYGSAFELDLLRTELNHLIMILERMAADLVRASPETVNPGFDPRSGQLSPEGRRQWQQKCDEFLNAAKPLTRLVEYMLKRTERYPQELRDLHELLTDATERLAQTVKSVKKARDRTHV